MGNTYLTILAGNPRGGEKTWESLKRHVLTPLNSDLAICTGSKWLNNQSFLDYTKYKWVFDEPSEWFEYYNQNFSGTWEQYFNLGKKTGLFNSGSIHFALKDIILNNYLDEINRYEYVIYTRFDQFYLNDHPKTKGENIWIPKGEDYFGLCDRHAVIPVTLIEKFLSICKYINQEKSLYHDDKFLNCEVSFKNHLYDVGLLNKVKRYDRSQFTAALNTDMTNWRVPKYRLYLYDGLMIKYPDEFMDSIKNMLKTKGIVFLLSHPIISLNYTYLATRRLLGKFKNFVKRG
tara:strand:+ start:1757 stop:2623 length:867 start_codon:yes stop_codon:yes gene_type:complete